MIPDMTLIQGTITGLKTAADIAVGFQKLTTMAEVQGKTIELQSAILAAQSSALAANGQQFSMLQRIRELEKEIADVKAWEATKQRYALYSPSPGVFVYALKKEAQETGPAHWICAKCYEESNKRILQKRIQEEGRRTYYRCDSCKSEVEMRHGVYDPTFS